MPQRQRVKQVKSDAVQGPDSWVKVRKPTVAEAREAQKLSGTGNEGLQRVVLDWNWVDDDGSPLAKPQSDPAVFDLLTADEINFISAALTADGTKN